MIRYSQADLTVVFQVGLTSSSVSALHSAAIKTDSGLVVPVVAVAGEESGEDRGSTLSLAGSDFEAAGSSAGGGNRGESHPGYCGTKLV